MGPKSDRIKVLTRDISELTLSEVRGKVRSRQPMMIWDTQPPAYKRNISTVQAPQSALLCHSTTLKEGQEARNRRAQLRFIYEGRRLLRGCSLSDSRDMGGKPIY